jgi:hypothetical protein
MAEKLGAGAQFPNLTLQVAGGTFELPAVKEDGYSIILFYRGHW